MRWLALLTVTALLAALTACGDDSGNGSPGGGGSGAEDDSIVLNLDDSWSCEDLHDIANDETETNSNRQWAQDKYDGKC